MHYKVMSNLTLSFEHCTSSNLLGQSLLGNLLPTIRTFNKTFDLIDEDNLILKLSSYQELTAN